MKNFIQSILLLLAFAVLPFSGRASVVIAETHSNVSCNGNANGSIDITSTGTAPYIYVWNDGILTQDRSNLTPGTYTLTVTDATPSTATISISITEPAILNTSKNITHVDCGGGNTGAIDLTAFGGNGGYTFAWSDFVYTEDRVSVTAANYYYTVTDALGCSRYDSANVTQPPGMVTSKVVTNVTCGSGANGAINLTVQFGIPGYTYLWNDGPVTEDRTAIAAGNYSVTITDASGCTTSATATVGQSGGGMGVNTTSVNPSCNGGSNGTITVTSVIGKRWTLHL
jgi:hypothetical protein